MPKQLLSIANRICHRYMINAEGNEIIMQDI